MSVNVSQTPKNGRCIVGSSEFDENTKPSDVLTLKELKAIATYLPVEVLFATSSFKYWQMTFINLYGQEYLKSFRELENDNQRYITFMWVIGCSLWKWNNSTWEHDKAEFLNRFSKEDWKKADNTIMYLACSVCIC